MLYACMYVRTYVCTCVCEYVSMCVCVYVCMCVYMSVCVFLHVCVYVNCTYMVGVLNICAHTCLHQRLDDGLATRFKQFGLGEKAVGIGISPAPALFPNFGLSNVGSGSTRIVMGNLVTSGLQRSDLRGLVGKNIEQKLWAFSIPKMW